MTIKRVLVTGASGFIGSALTQRLINAGWRVTSASRTTLIREVLSGQDAIVHLAGIAHRRAPDSDYIRDAENTASLAQAARAAGVKRFLFMSSTKAGGERSYGPPLTERDPPGPETIYGKSKLAAERAVLAIEQIAPVCLRPPLVHAADARANFAALLRLANTRWPLPFAGLKAKRNLIARNTLVEAVLTVLELPEGPSGVYYIADQPALSVTEIIGALRQGLGRAEGMIHMPLTRHALQLVPPLRALLEDHEIDDSAWRAAYGGTGGLDSHTALAETASAWKRRQH